MPSARTSIMPCWSRFMGHRMTARNRAIVQQLVSAVGRAFSMAILIQPTLVLSFVERQNLSMRMGMRRFTRLTNGFSKKLENHGHMVALYFMHYNFCRVHKTVRVKRAMEAGLTDHVWEIEELIGLI